MANDPKFVNGKYLIDVKDEFGWVTYAYFNDEYEAKREALELSKQFAETVLIDRDNQIVVDYLAVAP